MFKFEEFEFLKIIGTGAFGKVHLTSYKKNKNVIFAVKVLKWRKLLLSRQVDQLENEVMALKSLTQSRFITKLISVIDDGQNVGLVMEYVPGGELFYWLRKFGSFSVYATRFYASEILCGLNYIHEKGFLYRDLKPENILLTADGHIKLTDFGFSMLKGDSVRIVSGTPEYMPPEKIQSEIEGKEGDYWSFGIIIYEMLIGCPPFYDNDSYEIFRKILEGNILFPKKFPDDARDLILNLLNRTRILRLGFSGVDDVKSHVFFKDTNWNDVEKLKTVPPIVPFLYKVDDIHSFCENDIEDIFKDVEIEKPYSYTKIFK